MLNTRLNPSRGPRALARLPLALAILLPALASTALRADEPRWERKEFTCKQPEKGCYISSCCKDIDFSVYTREKEGTPVKEVKATVDFDAPPAKVFEVVTDYEHQSGNLPYVKDQKVFSRTESEVLFWTVAEFPMVSTRDWVLKATFAKNYEGGKYRVNWEVTDVKEAQPPVDGVVRLKINTGSWTLEPLDGGARTRGTYYLFTDPGGSIPSFMANKANTVALPDLIAAIRKRSTAK